MDCKFCGMADMDELADIMSVKIVTDEESCTNPFKRARMTVNNLRERGRTLWPSCQKTLMATHQQALSLCASWHHLHKLRGQIRCNHESLMLINTFTKPWYEWKGARSARYI